MGKKLFVSYSRNDQTQVADLFEDLSGFDHSPWMDEELTGGQDWWSEVLRQIRECDLFIFAVSHDSVTSDACLREYEYASALGKPVLPVTVRLGASDALLPAALGNIQRVDYSSPDRASLTRLIKSVDGMPEPSALPENLPPEPVIPATYLYDLNKEIGSQEHMDVAKQEEIVEQLRHQAQQGDSPEAVRHMIERMRRRDDLLVRVSSALDGIESTLPAQTAGQPAHQESEPVQRQEPVSTPPPPAEQIQQAQTQSTPPRIPGQQGPSGGQAQTPPVRPAQRPTNVNGAWWLAPIFGMFIGGMLPSGLGEIVSR